MHDMLCSGVEFTASAGGKCEKLSIHLSDFFVVSEHELCNHRTVSVTRAHTVRVVFSCLNVKSMDFLQLVLLEASEVL